VDGTKNHKIGGIIMTEKRRTGLAIGLAAACIAVLCAVGACNGFVKEEKAVRPAYTTSTTAITTTTTPPITTKSMTTTAVTTTESTTSPQITTAATCSTTETATTTITEQTTVADTTVQPTTTAASATATAPVPTEPYNGQTSGDYIYCIGFGWVFNEGGGGCGETNYEMYCNGNKIGYFG